MQFACTLHTNIRLCEYYTSSLRSGSQRQKPNKESSGPKAQQHVHETQLTTWSKASVLHIVDHSIETLQQVTELRCNITRLNSGYRYTYTYTQQAHTD